ncbi:MAG: hypothetical protein JO022_01995, partial [Acidobacteriaceae bacterium]|nr:hypothetical protein [Acidobacteriaceae bacterium]
NGQFASISSATASKQLNITGNSVAWTELLPATSQDLMITSPAGQFEAKFNEPAGYVTALLVKPGPFIQRIYPAAAVPSTLAIAPGMLISIYGTGFVSTALVANSLPFPTTLSGAQMLMNGSAIPLEYAGPYQVNAVVPSSASGLVKFQYSDSGGNVSQTVNALVLAAVPEIFTQDQSGAGPAAALNVSNAPVTASNPLHAGDYVSLYLTGLGTVHASNGLDVADLQPTVMIGGKPCPVTFAGRAPGYQGLDQINCQLAADVAPNASASVVVTSGAVTSNAPTVAIQ